MHGKNKALRAAQNRQHLNFHASFMDLRAQENLFGGPEKWQRIQLQQTAVQPAGTKVLLDTGTIRVRYRGTYVKIPVPYIRVLSGVLARST